MTFIERFKRAKGSTCDEDQVWSRSEDRGSLGTVSAPHNLEPFDQSVQQEIELRNHVDRQEQSRSGQAVYFVNGHVLESAVAQVKTSFEVVVSLFDQIQLAHDELDDVVISVHLQESLENRSKSEKHVILNDKSEFVGELL